MSVGRPVYIVGAVRTPIARGRADGALHDVHPVELLAKVLDEVSTRSKGTKFHCFGPLEGCFLCPLFLVPSLPHSSLILQSL